MTLLISAILSWAGVAAFCWVGAALARRSPVSQNSRTASIMFAVWWLGLAASGFFAGIDKLVVALGDPPLSLIVGSQMLSFTALCAALAGLIYYLTFLYTGREQAFWPLVIAYAAYCLWQLRVMATLNPVGVWQTDWQVGLRYEHARDLTGAIVSFVLLLGPQLLASLALFLVVRRLPRGILRLRVLVIAVGILLWMGSTVVTALSGVSGRLSTMIFQALLGILVGVTVLWVHQPPAWLRSRLPSEHQPEETRAEG